MNNFIDHRDPTKKLMEDYTSLQERYEKLTDKEKIIIGSQMLGMDHVPVTFEQFITDDYYLGNPAITNQGKSVFDIWKKGGKEIFPTPINTKTPYALLTGGIGLGKSTFCRLIAAYMYHRLDCCSNIYRSLGMLGGSKIGFYFAHQSEDTANRDFVRYFKDTLFVFSPYFKNLYNNPPIRLISSGPSSTSAIIGVNVILGVLSELEFWKPSQAVSRVNELITRYQSRFVNKRFNFGSVIVDSSSKSEEQSASEKFIELVPPEELYLARYSHWQARPELYMESKGLTFDFYKGDSIRTPHVIKEEENISDLDPDRIVKCPIQVKRNFILDPIRQMRDLLGSPYSSKDLFFGGSIQSVIDCSKIINQAPELIDDLDFYDLNDTLYSRLKPMIDKIPRRTTIFVSFDIGLKSDITGCSICYFDGEDVVQDGYSKTRYPKFCCPVIVGIGRKAGQSTSLDHIFQFLQRLTLDYHVIVTADSFASAGLFQSCERAGIEFKELSVDRTTEPYLMLKNIILGGRVTLAYNERFLRECSELRMVTTGVNGLHAKIDHPLISSSFEFDYKDRNGDMPGSKDLSDAVAASIWACYQKYSEYMEEGGGAVNKQIEIIKGMTTTPREEANQQFQSMLEDLF